MQLERFDFLLSGFGFVFAGSIFRVAEQAILHRQTD